MFFAKVLYKVCIAKSSISIIEYIEQKSVRFRSLHLIF